MSDVIRHAERAMFEREAEKVTGLRPEWIPDAVAAANRQFRSAGGFPAPRHDATIQPGTSLRSFLINWTRDRNTARNTPPAFGDGEMTGLHPYPVQTLGSIARMSPEEKLAYANEAAFRKAGVIQ